MSILTISPVANFGGHPLWTIKLVDSRKLYIEYFSFIDSHWKIEDNKLTNKAKYTIPGNWTIPLTAGEIGYIEDRDNSTKILGLNDETIDEGKVIAVEIMDKIKPDTRRAKFVVELVKEWVYEDFKEMVFT